MVDWTCLENKNNLPHVSIYFSLAELCIAVRLFFCCFFFPSPTRMTPRAQTRGLILCCAIPREAAAVVVLVGLSQCSCFLSSRLTRRLQSRSQNKQLCAKQAAVHCLTVCSYACKNLPQLLLPST